LIKSGVDLNRNYDFKFAFDDDGSSNDPCDEGYRGSAPFSEPETQAVRQLVEQSGRIASAMNFHAYGNMWIHPLCYYKEDDYERLLSPRVFRFYKAFDDQLRASGFKKVGTAQQTIGYVANGEASDWMLARHGIIGFNPELGNEDNDAKKFFPAKSKVSEILDYDFKAIDTFLKWNLPVFTSVQYKTSTLAEGQNNTKTFETLVEFSNDGIADLYDLSIMVEFQSANFTSSFISAEFMSNNKTVNKIGISEFSAANKTLLTKNLTVSKLSMNQLRMLSLDAITLDFSLLFFSKNKLIAEIKPTVSNQPQSLLTAIYIKFVSFANIVIFIVALFVGITIFIALNFIDRCMKLRHEATVPAAESNARDIEQEHIKPRSIN
jgi:hypothetical protein